MQKHWIKPFHWISAAVPIIIILIIAQVFMRYVMGSNLIVLEELQWNFYGIVIIMGVVYTALTDGNVRMDLFYARFKPGTKWILKIVEAIVFIIPFSVLMLIHGIDFAFRAYEIGESSINPGGLPYVWIMKAVIPVAMLLLCVVAIYLVVRNGLMKGHDLDGNN